MSDWVSRSAYTVTLFWVSLQLITTGTIIEVTVSEHLVRDRLDTDETGLEVSVTSRQSLSETLLKFNSGVGLEFLWKHVG